MQQFLEAIDRFTRKARSAARLRLLAPHVTRLEAALQQAFRAQGQAFITRLVRLADRFPVQEAAPPKLQPPLPGWEGLWDEAAEVTDLLFTGALAQCLNLGLVSGANESIATLRLGISFNLPNPRATAFIREHGAKLVKNINETTRDTIRGILSEGMEGGWSYNKTANAIIDRFEEFAVGRPQEHIDSRAHLVAATESGNAYEAGSYIPIADMMDAGLEMEKYWLTVNDTKVSELCAGNQAEGWILAGRAHASGHQHPLGHPACRCVEQYRRKGAEE